MSYQEQAQGINERLKLFFNKLSDVERAYNIRIDYTDLINQILRFGQVAKFRCRSNSAYDNFSKEVFKDIVELSREAPDGLGFEILKVKGL